MNIWYDLGVESLHDSAMTRISGVEKRYNWWSSYLTDFDLFRLASLYPWFILLNWSHHSYTWKEFINKLVNDMLLVYLYCHLECHTSISDHYHCKIDSVYLLKIGGNWVSRLGGWGGGGEWQLIDQSINQQPKWFNFGIDLQILCKISFHTQNWATVTLRKCLTILKSIQFVYWAGVSATGSLIRG